MTPDEINRLNAEAWAEWTPRFERLVRTLPQTLARAVESQQFKPVIYQDTLEARMFDAEAAAEESRSASQSAAARKPRQSKKIRPSFKKHVTELMRRERSRDITQNEFIKKAAHGEYWKEDGLRLYAYKDNLADRSGMYDLKLNDEIVGQDIDCEKYDKDGNPVINMSWNGLKTWWTAAKG